MDENFRRLYEGTFPVPPRILAPTEICRTPSARRYGLRSHRMSWKSDHIAVCRDCGGVYDSILDEKWGKK